MEIEAPPSPPEIAIANQSQPSASLGKPLVSVPSTDLLIHEPVIDPEIVKLSIDKAWNDGINIILAKYTLKPETVKAQLTQSLGKEPDQAALDKEIRDRTAALAANQTLKKAIDYIQKAIASAKSADIALASNDLLPEDKRRPSEDIRVQYLNDRDGLYFEVDAKGKPTKNTIDLSLAVKPIMDELKIILNETTQDKPTEKTLRAKQAAAIAQMLTPRLVQTDSGGYKFDKTPDFSIVRRVQERVEEQKVRELLDNEMSLGWDILEKLLGYDVTECLKKGNGDKRISKKMLKELEGMGVVGNLGLLLTSYDSLDQNVLLDDRAALGALVHETLNGLEAVPPQALSDDPQLFQALRENNGQNTNFFEKEMTDYKKMVLRAGGFEDELIKKPGFTDDIPAARVFEILRLTTLCESEVQDNKGKKELSERANTLLNTYIENTGLPNTTVMRQLLATLTIEQRGSKLLTRMGLDVEQLKDPEKAEAHAHNLATKVVEAIRKRREKRGDTFKLTADDIYNYFEVAQHHILDSYNKFKENSKFAGWIRALGILALLFSPMIEQVLGGLDDKITRGDQPGSAG